MKRKLPFAAVIACIILLWIISACTRNSKNNFESKWINTYNSDWVGPDYWANRLQDWEVKDGRLVCIQDAQNKPMRTVHLLTRKVNITPGKLNMLVETGLIADNEDIAPDAATGFLFGSGESIDYRAAALIHHSYGEGAGYFAGINGEGQLFIRDFNTMDKIICVSENNVTIPWNVKLELNINYVNGNNIIEVKAIDIVSGDNIAAITTDKISTELCAGNIALVSHPGSGENTARFWFRNWEVEGSKLDIFEDRNCGPILSTQYSLSKGILKLTAQMMPLGHEDNKTVEFQIQKEKEWSSMASTNIIEPGYTAAFRIEDWDSSKDIPYRISYKLTYKAENEKIYYRYGRIRHDPVEKENIIVAAFTGNHNVAKPKGKWAGVDAGEFLWNENVWFPHELIIKHVTSHKPDVLFFSGDQVYEGASPTGADRINGMKDYLYKWYLWCWAFRDLTDDIPAVTIPDDHDVYHGNLWGAGGKATPEGLAGANAQDAGGYKMSPEFVKMVERTQTSHLPDPYDPTPIEQGIGVYYCDMNYGGISFGIVEDRKFKSAPKALIPKANVYNGWPLNPKFNAKRDADVIEAKLLGDRQLNFLENWAADWTNNTWMKVLLSQTIFCNVATLPAEELTDAVVPRLRILPEGEYAQNDKKVSDMDSNGWPQSGRNRALKTLRKAFAIHIAGDQHLGSTIHYGIEEYNDASFALCVPSVANFFPRRWFPPEAGKNRKANSPKYTGEFEDGFGNKMTVHAVSNPALTERKPSRLYELAAGYGIAKINRNTRDIIFENWPIWSDPVAGGKPYFGWPVKFNQLENYDKKAKAFLPEIKVEGMEDPVIQIINESTKEIIYTLRIKGNSFIPKVYENGLYSIKIGEPGTENFNTYTGLSAKKKNQSKPIMVNFN
ncbi:alkaline phosphatase D family protein [Bacteroidota bacterium]